MNILVGTAGAPISSQQRTTFSGIKRVKELGLDAMEVEFTHGVRMGKETARELGEHRSKYGIALSVHGPYYINLNSKEAKKIKDSEERIIASAERAALFGGNKVVFHPGFYSGKNEQEAMTMFHRELDSLVQEVEQKRLNVHLAPETMGKPSQFGSLEELVTLCQQLPELRLTFDFAHIFAREQGKADFHKSFAYIEDCLGKAFLKDMHMHFSGIEFGPKGERRHLVIDDPGNKLKLEQITEVLKAFDVEGTLICESPNIEEDALKMKKLLE
ncbi:TIM barrel protein [archaeon]|nr:TIM barrel protein [archaeon]